LAERTTEKRELILQAAVRVFARKGYHTCRVGDIAEEAGVAHGLLYHYFRSKEEVLETVFRDTWSDLLAAVERIGASNEPAQAQLRAVAAFYLGSWLRAPDLIRVLVREVARSPDVGRRVDEIAQVFDALQRMIERGQERGELRSDVDARLVTWALYGALEELLTGWVLGRLPDGEEDVARAVDTVVEVIGAGLVASTQLL
jgi:TetR/AcrR family fatty acid metabolism transcriptional regulator